VNKRKKDRLPEEHCDYQDDRFYYIAGYTSGGAPFGVTWEEMELNKCEKGQISIRRKIMYKKLDLNKAAGEFEIIGPETHLFYNVETGEFDHYNDYMEADIADSEKFDDDAWVAAPSQWDISDFNIMTDFAESVSDRQKREMLCVALNGRGAFRRFKDTLDRVQLVDEWYEYKRKAYIRVAREWCERYDIPYLDNEEAFDDESAQQSEPDNSEPLAPAVLLATLESHNHIVGDIERGVKVYNSGGVEFEESGSGFYLARVPHKGGLKTVSVTFSHDGQDIIQHYCACSGWDREPPVCRHVVATVLAIQGGIVESSLVLGKTATVRSTVTEDNTAKAMRSGSLDVFATPMMIALMEQAACECLYDCLDEGQTSVGSSINVEHTKPSPVGAEITATATIEFVFGRRVEFIVTASDVSGEIGKGRHNRSIVDKDRFSKKIYR